MEGVAEHQKRVEYFFVELNYQFFEVEFGIVMDSAIAMILIDYTHYVHDEDIVVLILGVIELLPRVDCLQKLFLGLALALGDAQLGDVFVLSVVAVDSEVFHLQLLADEGGIWLLLRTVHEYLLVASANCIHLQALQATPKTIAVF